MVHCIICSVHNMHQYVIWSVYECMSSIAMKEEEEEEEDDDEEEEGREGRTDRYNRSKITGTGRDMSEVMRDLRRRESLAEIFSERVVYGRERARDRVDHLSGTR